MRNHLRLRLPLRERRCAPTGHRWRPLRRQRPYVVTFEHIREPLRLRAADFRELRAYLQARHSGKRIVSIRDEHGRLAGTPPVPLAGGGARPWQAALILAPTLGGVAYGVSWLLT